MGNTVMSVICLLIGLALLGVGIYLLTTGGSKLTGGVLVGLGALIIALFACTMYLILNFDKLQRKAEDKAAREAEARRAERRREADRLRAERGLPVVEPFGEEKNEGSISAEREDDNIENVR